MSRATVITALAVALLIGTAEAETVHLKGGGSLNGHVVSLTSKSLGMILNDENGARVTLPVSRISDSSLYAIRSERIDPHSVSAHEKLGDWAANRGLLKDAVVEYEDAEGLAGDGASHALVTKLSKVDERWAGAAFQRVKAMEDKEQYFPAKKLLTSVEELLSGTPAARQAQRAVARLNREMRRVEKAENKDLETAADSAETESAFEEIQRLVDQGDRWFARGRNDELNLSRAVRDYRSSIAAYHAAGTLLTRSRTRPGSEEAALRFDRVERRVEARKVRTYAQLGEEYLLNGNTIRAERTLKLASRIDPLAPGVSTLRHALLARRKAVMGTGWGWWPHTRILGVRPTRF